MSRLIMLPCAAFLRVYEPLSGLRAGRAGALGGIRRIRRQATPGRMRSKPSVKRRCAGLSRCRRSLHLHRRVITLTCAGQTGSRTCARGRRGSGRGWRWAGCGPRRRRRSRTRSRPVRPTGPLRTLPGGRGRRWRRGSTSRAAPGRCRRPGSFRSRRPSAGWCSVRAGDIQTSARRPRRRPARSSTRRPWPRRAGGWRGRSPRSGALPGQPRRRRDRGQDPGQGARAATAALVRVSVALEEVGRWLEEFHPHSLVELDYGGLGSAAR